MSIGSVLLHRDRLQRAQRAAEPQLVFNDVVDTVTRIVGDAAHGGAVLRVLERVVMGLPERFLAHAGGSLDDAGRRFLALVQPLQDKLVEIGAGFSSAQASQVLASLRGILDLVIGLLGDLQPAGARDLCRRITTIVKESLKLTPAFLEDLVFFFLDDAVAGLQAAALDAAPDEHETLVEMALLIRRLERNLRGNILIPEIDPDRLAQVLLDALAQPAVQNVVKKATCISTAITTALEAGSAVLDLVPFTGMGSRSVGAGDAGTGGAGASGDRLHWYATWLLGGKDRGVGLFFLGILVKLFQLPLPNDQIIFTGQKVTRSNFARGDEDLTTSGDIDYAHLQTVRTSGDPAEIRKYTFKHVSKETMEDIARHTAWITHAIEAILHGTSIEEGDFLSNLGFIGYNAAEGLHKAIRSKPFHPLAVILLRFATYLGFSFEGIQTKAAPGQAVKFWLTLVGTDALEANIYFQLAESARDALLSFLTLLNFEGAHDTPRERDDRPNNRQEVEGIVAGVVGISTSWILCRIIPRKDYIRPFNDVKTTLGYWIGGGVLATAFLAGTVGTVLAESVAWAEDFVVWGHQLWKSAVQILVAYWPTLFMAMENDTDGGKYNPRGGDFAGYPDAATSPYKLPWSSGVSYYCAQGNQGFWSHNDFAARSQVYAYDFALDQADEILAARGGTVVDFFDWVPDDSDPSTSAPTMPDPTNPTGPPIFITVNGQTTSSKVNCIVIRHDAWVVSHDPGTPAAPVTTYSSYLHGRTGGVRRIFARRLGVDPATITPQQIIGQTVVQGNPIMEAGSTGNSLHNHVHVEIRIANPGVGAVLTRSNDLNMASMPFVFADVDRLFKPKGVPQSLDFYTSSNVRVAP